MPRSKVPEPRPENKKPTGQAISEKDRQFPESSGKYELFMTNYTQYRKVLDGAQQIGRGSRGCKPAHPGEKTGGD